MAMYVLEFVFYLFYYIFVNIKLARWVQGTLPLTFNPFVHKCIQAKKYHLNVSQRIRVCRRRLVDGDEVDDAGLRVLLVERLRLLILNLLLKVVERTEERAHVLRQSRNLKVVKLHFQTIVKE